MIEFYQVEIHPKKLSGSPYVLAVEMFLKHKNLDWEPKLLKFNKVGDTIRSLTNGEWSRVPTLIFPNGDISFDSLKIADYLDKNYPSNPLNPHNQELDELIEYYDKNCNFSAFKMVVMDIFNSLDEDNKKYFRDTREPFFKCKIEELPGNRGENIQNYFKSTKPIIDHLEKNKFIDGDKPLIHDYCLISRIQMIKTISPNAYKELVDDNPSEAFRNWIESMGNLFNGYLKNRKTALSN